MIWEWVKTYESINFSGMNIYENQLFYEVY